jgi:Protein of unknown function with PCYCGC motif
MKALAKICLCLLFVGMTAAWIALPQFAGSRAPQMPGMQSSGADEAVPSFHTKLPQTPLPPTLEPSQFTDKVVFNAYLLAGRIRKILYQEPCYCHCDRGMGHGSLLDCFAGQHGSVCDICIREAFYSYEQTHKGKTPAQIRDGIVRGEWKQVDVSKYQADYLPQTAAPAKSLAKQ